MTPIEDQEQLVLVRALRTWISNGFASEISIAKEVGVSRNTVNRWVNGKRAIKSGHRKLLARMGRAIWVESHINPLLEKDPLSLALLALWKHHEDELAQKAALMALELLPANDKRRLDVILAALLVFAPLPVVPPEAMSLIEQGARLAESDAEKARVRLFAANFRLKALRAETKSSTVSRRTAEELCDEYASIFKTLPNVLFLFNALEVANEFSLSDIALRTLDRIHTIRDRGVSDACKSGVLDVRESVTDPSQLLEVHRQWKDWISYLLKLPMYRDPSVPSEQTSTRKAGGVRL